MSNAPLANALELKSITRNFEQAGNVLHVLRGIDLAVQPGEIVALLGQSGAGKSTLLQISGLLEPASGGEVWIDGRNCSAMKDAGRTAVRRARLGFVYQFHHLLPEFSAVENVELPLMIAGLSKSDAGKEAAALLGELGLGQRLSHRPARLSGGEQQRVALARAIVNRPALLLADEPTGNLDEATADVVLDQLIGLVRTRNVAALIATHNVELAQRMDRQILLRDGHLHDV